MGVDVSANPLSQSRIHELHEMLSFVYPNIGMEDAVSWIPKAEETFSVSFCNESLTENLVSSIFVSDRERDLCFSWKVSIPVKIKPLLGQF